MKCDEVYLLLKFKNNEVISMSTLAEKEVDSKSVTDVVEFFRKLGVRYEDAPLKPDFQKCSLYDYSLKTTISENSYATISNRR